MRKRMTASCHCGAVRVEADVDLSAGTFKCNCSICSKTRMWGVDADPATFRVAAGEADLVDYHPFRVHHMFCRHCGVRLFGWGDEPELGGRFYVLRVSSLEGVTDEELVNAPVRYFNGRDDDYRNPPAVTRHL